MAIIKLKYFEDVSEETLFHKYIYEKSIQGEFFNEYVVKSDYPIISFYNWVKESSVYRFQDGWFIKKRLFYLDDYYQWLPATDEQKFEAFNLFYDEKRLREEDQKEVLLVLRRESSRLKNKYSSVEGR